MSLRSDKDKAECRGKKCLYASKTLQFQGASDFEAESFEFKLLLWKAQETRFFEPLAPRRLFLH